MSVCKCSLHPCDDAHQARSEALGFQSSEAQLLLSGRVGVGVGEDRVMIDPGMLEKSSQRGCL